MAFMELARVQGKLERVERLQVALSVPLTKAMQQAEWPAQSTEQLRAPETRQPVEPRLLLESRPAQVMPVRAIAPVVER